jgi:hypothetical protein
LQSLRVALPIFDCEVLWRSPARLLKHPVTEVERDDRTARRHRSRHLPRNLTGSASDLDDPLARLQREHFHAFGTQRDDPRHLRLSIQKLEEQGRVFLRIDGTKSLPKSHLLIVHDCSLLKDGSRFSSIARIASPASGSISASANRSMLVAAARRYASAVQSRSTRFC